MRSWIPLAMLVMLLAPPLTSAVAQTSEPAPFPNPAASTVATPAASPSRTPPQRCAVPASSATVTYTEPTVEQARKRMLATPCAQGQTPSLTDLACRTTPGPAGISGLGTCTAVVHCPATTLPCGSPAPPTDEQLPQTAAANAAVTAANRAVEARNAAAKAKYEAEQRAYEATLARQKAEAERVRREHEAAQAAWRARVAACNAGDRSQCGT